MRENLLLRTTGRNARLHAMHYRVGAIVLLVALVKISVSAQTHVVPPESDKTIRQWIDHSHELITAGNLDQADSLLGLSMRRNYSPRAYYERARIRVARGDAKGYCQDLFEAQAMELPAIDRLYGSECVLKDSGAFSEFGLSERSYPGMIRVVRQWALKDETLMYSLYDSGDSLRIAIRVDNGDTLFSYTDDMPEFPGGWDAFYKYMGKNMKFPKTGSQGRVYVRFEIGKDGSLASHRIERGSHASLNEEALRVLKAMDPWRPGTKDGTPVKFTFVLPIRFHTEN